jgi:simple sugar transport system permease protein
MPDRRGRIAGAPDTAAPGDDRVRRLSLARRFMARPEATSIAGTVLVFAIFGWTAGGSGMFALDGVMNWAVVSGYLGILAVGACLLMIGGEFDLSLGSMIGFTGMVAAIPPLHFGWRWRSRWHARCCSASSTASSWSAPGCRRSS